LNISKNYTFVKKYQLVLKFTQNKTKTQQTNFISM